MEVVPLQAERIFRHSTHDANQNILSIYTFELLASSMKILIVSLLWIQTHRRLASSATFRNISNLLFFNFLGLMIYFLWKRKIVQFYANGDKTDNTYTTKLNEEKNEFIGNNFFRRLIFSWISGILLFESLLFPKNQQM